MTIRSQGPAMIALLTIACWGSGAAAQDTSTASPQRSAAAQAAARAAARSESRVSAEMVKGKLNPATSKPGDEIAVRLNEDVKSNGQVVLKKGSTVRGIVKKVQRTENKSAAKGNASAQSMMELEWIAPALSGTASQHLNLALQSVVYTNPLYAQQQQQESGGDSGFSVPRSTAPTRGSATGGLVGGVGGAVSSVTAVGAGVSGAPGAASAGVLTQTSSSLTAPAALPVNAQTASSLHSNFGVSGDQLFHMGGGQAISSGGTVTSMDIFTHMSNDTVITSPSRDFEVSSGAQMQLLVQAGGK